MQPINHYNQLPKSPYCNERLRWLKPDLVPENVYKTQLNVASNDMLVLYQGPWSLESISPSLLPALQDSHPGSLSSGHQLPECQWMLRCNVASSSGFTYLGSIVFQILALLFCAVFLALLWLSINGTFFPVVLLPVIEMVNQVIQSPITFRKTLTRKCF